MSYSAWLEWRHQQGLLLSNARVEYLARNGLLNREACAGFGLGGGASFGGQGTRGVQYQKTAEQDPSTGSGPKTTIYYTSLCAMPAYSGKSHEELRWEDYQVPTSALLSSVLGASLSLICIWTGCMYRADTTWWHAGWVQGKHRHRVPRRGLWANLGRPVWAAAGQRALRPG